MDVYCLAHTPWKETYFNYVHKAESSTCSEKKRDLRFDLHRLGRVCGFQVHLYKHTANEYTLKQKSEKVKKC